MLDLLPPAMRAALLESDGPYEAPGPAPRNYPNQAQLERNEAIAKAWEATDERHRSTHQLGKIHGISHERVRQIIKAYKRRQARLAAQS